MSWRVGKVVAQWSDPSGAVSVDPDEREQFISELVCEPPSYLALDLWMSLALPIDAFDAYYERNGWASTWANLLYEVRASRGASPCGEPAGDGERCVLLAPGHLPPHMGASDVGSHEPLPGA